MKHQQPVVVAAPVGELDITRLDEVDAMLDEARDKAKPPPLP